MHYAGLGNAQSMAEKLDPILVHSNAAANKVITAIQRLPALQREREMNRMLDELEPGLASKVRTVANTLGKKTTSPKALRSALRLVLADWSIAHIQKLGRGRKTVSGLGANAGTVIRDIGQGLVCGVASSNEARALAARLAGGGQTTGAMSSNAGFDVARQICPGAGGGSSTPLPPPPEPVTSSIPWVPILVGGTLLVGIVVFVKMRS